MNNWENFNYVAFGGPISLKAKIEEDSAGRLRLYTTFQRALMKGDKKYAKHSFQHGTVSDKSLKEVYAWLEKLYKEMNSKAMKVFFIQRDGSEKIARSADEAFSRMFSKVNEHRPASQIVWLNKDIPLGIIPKGEILRSPFEKKDRFSPKAQRLAQLMYSKGITTVYSCLRRAKYCGLSQKMYMMHPYINFSFREELNKLNLCNDISGYFYVKLIDSKLHIIKGKVSKQFLSDLIHYEGIVAYNYLQRNLNKKHKWYYYPLHPMMNPNRNVRYDEDSKNNPKDNHNISTVSEYLDLVVEKAYKSELYIDDEDWKSQQSNINFDAEDIKTEVYDMVNDDRVPIFKTKCIEHVRSGDSPLKWELEAIYKSISKLPETEKQQDILQQLRKYIEDMPETELVPLLVMEHCCQYVGPPSEMARNIGMIEDIFRTQELLHDPELKDKIAKMIIASDDMSSVSGEYADTSLKTRVKLMTQFLEFTNGDKEIIDMCYPWISRHSYDRTMFPLWLLIQCYQ